MIISRTPFRISFFGGGTDFPVWYQEHGGAVLSTSIDKYCYMSCRNLPPFFDYKYRIIYSQQENVNTFDEINHPSAREVLRYLNYNNGLVIHHDGDLPARSGLGSSSSFTVGLLHNMYSRIGKVLSKRQLALEAINIEQNILKENVGSQDQVIAAYGGFNRIDFGGDKEFEVNPITIGKEKLSSFHSNLMLFYTGVQRIASHIEKEKIENLNNKLSELNTIYFMVNEAIDILNSSHEFDDFGKLLHEYWLLKKKLSSKTSNEMIDDIYETAIKAGALGGKILGAGSGGFILFYVRPENQEKVKKVLSKLLYIPFNFDMTGSQIIYYGINNEYL